MGSFGERLRREREMRGIGLDEIAAATKISTRNLRALEDEKFNQLPGGIFNKGFVRAYAKFLGIDQDQIVAEYEAASHETETAREQKLQEDFAKAEFRKQKKDEDREISLEPKSQWGTIAAIVLIAAIGYGGYSYYQRRKLEKLQQPTPPPAITQHTPQSQPPATTSTTPTPEASSTPAGSTAPGNTTAGTAPSSSSSTPVGATATPPSTKPDTARTGATPTEPARPATQKSETSPVPNESPSASTPIELKLKVNRESWVSIKADGKTLINTTLQAGTEKTFKATDKIEMILGNAGGVEVSYNGKPVENVNLGQDVRKLTFTATGYQ